MSVRRTGASAAAKTEEGDELPGDALAVWPNPTTGALRVVVAATDGAAVHVEIFDALGRAVATLYDGVHGGGPLDVAFDGGGLAPGAYVVRAECGEGTLTGRVTVVR